MRRFGTVACAVAALLLSSSALAQRNYDSKTVETIQGKVVSVEKMPSRRGHGYGVHLMVQTDKETIAVHLGPARYVEKQTPRIETNDTISVTGSRVKVDGKPALIAAEVKKGNEILKLRGENGVPMWSGRGRHGQ